MKERWIARGYVQGVGFRYFVCVLAKHFGVTGGYVANLADGSVEIVLSGDKAFQKKEFLQAIQKGKKGTHIKVESFLQEPTHLASFEAPEDSFVIF